MCRQQIEDQPHRRVDRLARRFEAGESRSKIDGHRRCVDEADAEDQARRRKQVFLKDWETKLDEFLRFNDREVMVGKGSVGHAEATRLAEAEYEAFAAQRRAMLEAEAEREQQRALEDAAKALPKPPTAATKPKKCKKSP